jgi:cardiolipin synthase
MVGNIPNILTLTRILLLPFFAATLFYEQYQYALLIFVTASITDLLDGFIARVKKQITYFGTILDPVADKFFLLTSFIMMSKSDLIPMWLTIIVISRDLIVITGCFIIYFVTNNLDIEPSIVGKIASAGQFLLIGLILLSLNFNSDMTFLNSLFILVAVLTAMSGFHYVYRGLKVANP